MKFKESDFLSLSKKEIFEKLKTSEAGLSEKEAENRIKIYGKNELPKKKKGGSFLLFLRQFKSALIYILFVAAFISYQFEHYIDAYVILAIVFINAIIGFFQGWRAEKILDALKKMITSYARVLRSGREIRISAKDVVLGDIVILEAGDKAVADIRILESKNVTVNESSLTGESVPVEKNSQILSFLPKEGLPKNMLFMGSSLISGYAKGVVTATGINTKLGEIAQTLKKIKYEKSHFEKKVDELVFQVGVIASFFALLTFLIGFYFRGLEFFDIFLFSVASLVAGVPSALPAVLTIVLAIGAAKMAKKNAMIKHLPSVETLGVANVICTDKTGTLTKNILTVKKIFIFSEIIDVSGAGLETKGNFSLNGVGILPKFYPNLDFLLKASLYLSDASVVEEKNSTNVTGEPVEVALDIASLKGEFKKSEILKKVDILDKIPFDTKCKYKANLVNLGLGGHQDNKIFISGAFEVVLEKSSYFYKDGKKIKLTAKIRNEILEYALDMAQDALKVVGVAFKDAEKNINCIFKKDISDLVFVGFFGMIDPPKEGVSDAILKCKISGIRVLMLTGDHKDTAVAIAKDIELLPREENYENKVFTEADLFKISDEKFKNILKEAVIFARVTPETKLKIAKILQKQGNIVAMTGDGVNDAPALKQADIGVAMGITGTDVAKESSEIILTDDNFSSIVNAISEGRLVFSNVKKTTFYLTTTNVAESVTIISSLSMGLPLPLLPTQLLWLNLVTDGVTVIALATEPKEDGILIKKPRSQKEKILSKDIIPLFFFTVVLMVFGTLALFLYYLPEGIDKARTIAFSFMAFSQFFNVVNMRSLDVSIFKIGFFSNRFMVFALIASIIIQLIVIYVPFFQSIFRFESLNIKEWILIIISSSLIFFVVELYKFFKRRS